jgi:hypothetical protein
MRAFADPKGVLDEWPHAHHGYADAKGHELYGRIENNSCQHEPAQADRQCISYPAVALDDFDATFQAPGDRRKTIDRVPGRSTVGEIRRIAVITQQHLGSPMSLRQRLGVIRKESSLSGFKTNVKLLEFVAL